MITAAGNELFAQTACVQLPVYSSSQQFIVPIATALFKQQAAHVVRINQKYQSIIEGPVHRESEQTAPYNGLSLEHQLSDTASKKKLTYIHTYTHIHT